MITTSDSQPLSDKIEDLVRDRGIGWAVNAGIAIVAPEAQVLRGAVTGILKATPLNEGEGVFWHIPSARGGMVEVWVVNPR